MSEANKKEERKKEVLGNQAKAEVKGDDDILGEMLEGKMPVPSEPLRNQAGEEISGSEEVPGPARTIEGARPEVELEVLRIPANPRCVICRYRLLADEVRINLWVKTNKNFKRGMKLVMHEQAGEDWKFEGVLPRHAGRW